MIDVSGFGSSVTVIATGSFPQGFQITEFADDKNPIEAKEIEPTGFEMLYDGSLFAFDKAAAVLVDVSVVAGSEDDINCKILLQARKGSPKIIPLPDVTSIVIANPNNGTVTLSGGTIISGPLVDTVLPSGRKQGNTYSFAFGTFAGAQSLKQLISTVAQTALSFL
jgi:hypothetical protein